LPPKGDEEVETKKASSNENGPSNGNGAGAFTAPAANGHGKADSTVLERVGLAVKVDENGGPMGSRNDQFARFQCDAPSCENCGAITVRNGNCYLCHNCGNSMGCS
jgi:ribonucleoside-diphosphate reductase alpha chain